MTSGDGESVVPAIWFQNEAILLSELIQLLGKRPGHVLLLSDLGALLPAQLRIGVKRVGGLRTWLEKFPELFQVTGQTGKESVTLMLGTQSMDSPRLLGKPAQSNEPTHMVPSAHLSPTQVFANSGDCRLDSQQELPKHFVWADENDADDDMRDDTCAVLLRGIPHRASVDDIKAFLGEHVQELKEEIGPTPQIGSHAVKLILDHKGRISGFARLQFKTREAAQRCKEEVHMKTMEDRYVECFLYDDPPFKMSSGIAKNKVVEEYSEGEPQGPLAHPRPLTSPIDISHVTPEQVCQEVEQYLQAAGQNRMLLSMLGVALSQESRTFLKKSKQLQKQGLKEVLAYYPHLFHVEGTRGCETLTYTPDCPPQTASHPRLPPGTEGEAKVKSPDLGEKASSSKIRSHIPGLDSEVEVRRERSDQDKGPRDVQQSYESMKSTDHRSSPQFSQFQFPWAAPVPERFLSPQGKFSSADPVDRTPEKAPLPHLLVEASHWESSPKNLHFGGEESSSTGKQRNRVGRSSSCSAASSSGFSKAIAPRSSSGPTSPQFSESGRATPKGIRTPSNWGTPLADDEMPIPVSKETIPHLSSGFPQVPVYFNEFYDFSFGSAGNASMTSGAPQNWVVPPQMMSVFPTCQGPQQTLQGDWSEHLRIMADFHGLQPPLPCDWSNLQVVEGGSEVLEPPLQGNWATSLEGFSVAAPTAAIPKKGKGSQAKNASWHETQGVQEEDAQVHVLRLRGLPLTAGEQDVLELFSFHNVMKGIAQGEGAVSMVLDIHGKLSGQAVVKMRDRWEADAARKALNSQWMGDHYIEVFSDSESNVEMMCSSTQHCFYTSSSRDTSSSSGSTIGGQEQEYQQQEPVEACSRQPAVCSSKESNSARSDISQESDHRSGTSSSTGDISQQQHQQKQPTEGGLHLYQRQQPAAGSQQQPAAASSRRPGNRRMEWWADAWTDEQTDGWDGWTDGRMDGTDEQTDRRTDGPSRTTDGRTH